MSHSKKQNNLEFFIINLLTNHKLHPIGEVFLYVTKKICSFQIVDKDCRRTPLIISFP